VSFIINERDDDDDDDDGLGALGFWTCWRRTDGHL